MFIRSTAYVPTLIDRSTLLAAFALLPIVYSTHAFAAPDAGDILRQQPQPPAVTPVQKPQVTPAVPAEAEKDTGPKILVKGFRIEGAVLISEAELVAQLKDAVGKELSFQQLQGTTFVLIAYYAEKGYLARVILPEQDIKDGIVTLQVIEGKRGNLRINSTEEHINAARVERFIDRRLANGDAMNIANLGEALNILNEQPGIAATSSLAPGKGEGEIDVVVNASPKPPVGLNFGVNNHGSRSTGEMQESVGITLGNPTGYFDQAAVTANVSDGTTYGRLDYSVAVGDAGLRLGANTSNLSYHLTQPSFAALQANGTAATYGLTASYPLARRAEFNLSISGSVDNKRLIDNTVAGETGNRRVAVGNLELSGYTMGGSLLGGGIASFGAGVSFGNSDQRNAGALNADSTTRQVQGRFGKLSINAGYLRSLTSDWSLNATLRAQYAGKNLDSTERMSLGGPSGVRAYPVGEASGDDAALFTFNLGRKITDKLSANLFADTGAVHVNHKAWSGWNAANPNQPNTYLLNGVGAALDWRFTPQAVLNATVATPLGNNPGRDANNLNSDGRANGTRGWFSLNAQF